MNSKNVLHLVTLSILMAAVFVPSTDHARSDVLDLPATATITEQNLPSWLVVVPEIEQNGSAGHTSKPLSIEIDQNQPSGPIYMAGFGQGDLAQSFMQSYDNIAGAGILVGGNLLMILVTALLALATFGLALIIVPVAYILGIAWTAHELPDWHGRHQYLHPWRKHV